MAAAKNKSSSWFLIDQVVVDTDGVRIKTGKAPSKCSSDSFRLHKGKNGMTSSLLNRALANLLLAAEATREVQVTYQDNSSKCYVKSVKVRFD